MKYSKIAFLSALALLPAAPSFAADTIVTPTCPTTAISHTLRVGSRDAWTGGDVTALQTFLGIAPTTGYFGAITRGKVIAWQRDHGVVPASGLVGPLTRAAITKQCTGDSGNPNMSFTASPTTGTAPLAVDFEASGSAFGKGQYIVDYGDGANSGPLQSYCIPATDATASSSCSFSAGHTYSSAGSYSAVLESYVACMWSNPRCELATQTLGTAVITVGKVATTSSLTVPGSVKIAPGASAKNTGTYSTFTLTVNSVSVTALTANITWTESHCGTAGCLGAADPAAQTVTLYLSGGNGSYTSALGHVITLTAVSGGAASFDISK